MKEYSKVKGETIGREEKGCTFTGRTRKGERDKETFYWKQHDESEGSERVSRREGRGRRGEDRERPYMFCLKQNVSYIRDKGGN